MILIFLSFNLNLVKILRELLEFYILMVEIAKCVIGIFEDVEPIYVF